MNTRGVDDTLKQLYGIARDSHTDPTVRAWAENALITWLTANGYADVTDVTGANAGQALTEAFRKFRYVPDPTTEFAPSPAMFFRTAELSEFGMDADDAAVAFGAAAMSLGYEVALIGQSFDKKMGIHHVIVAIKDENGSEDVWLRYDPCYGKGPSDLRESKQPVEERWFKPSDK